MEQLEGRFLSQHDRNKIEGTVCKFLCDKNVEIRAAQIPIETSSNTVEVNAFMEQLVERYAPYVTITWMHDFYDFGIMINMERRTNP